MSILFEGALLFGILILVLGFLTKGQIFTSLFNRAKDAANQANEKVRDPVVDGRIAIQEAEAELLQIKQKRRGLLTEIAGQQAELKELKQEELKWENLAVRAGSKGNAEDVRQALAKKLEVTTEILDVEKELAEYDALDESMAKAIESRADEIREAKSSSVRLSRSIQLDTFRESVALDSLGESGTANSLKRLREDAKTARNRAVAVEQEARTDEPTIALEKRYALESGVSDDDVSRYLKTSETAAQ